MMWFVVLHVWLTGSAAAPVEYLNCSAPTVVGDGRLQVSVPVKPASQPILQPHSQPQPTAALSTSEVDRLLLLDAPLIRHSEANRLHAMVVCADGSATLTIQNDQRVLAERGVELSDPAPLGNERFVAVLLAEMMRKLPTKPVTDAAASQPRAETVTGWTNDQPPPPLSQRDGVWSTFGATPFGPGDGMRIRLAGGFGDDNLALSWQYFMGVEDDFDFSLGFNVVLWPLGGSPGWLGARYRIFQLRAIDFGVELQTGPKLTFDGSETPSGWEVVPGLSASILLSRATAISVSAIFPTMLFFSRPQVAPGQLGALGLGGRVSFTYNTRSWVGFFIYAEAAVGFPLWQRGLPRTGNPVRTSLYGATIGVGPQIRF